MRNKMMVIVFMDINNPTFVKKAYSILFMRRYWNGETVDILAQENGTSPANMATRMG